MAKRREIQVGQVYAPRSKLAPRRKFRRVIEVSEGVVFYSAGGDRNYHCTLAAFKRATKPEPLPQTGPEMFQLAETDMTQPQSESTVQDWLDEDGYPTELVGNDG